MGVQVATIIVEPRLLVRQALESLMMHHSYRVVCGVGSTADVADPSILAEGPRLAILGAQSADNAVAEAIGIRKLWPDSKIILLFEQTSLLDFQKLLASQVDGCVPLSVSPETLIGALDLVMTKDIRVMVMAEAKRPAVVPVGTSGTPGMEADGDMLPSSSTHSQSVPGALLSLPRSLPIGNGIGPAEVGTCNGDSTRTSVLRNVPRLSEREAQILDGLVKGHANKVIARTCDITEATVKVHMKSILRKIRVTNRTQAAIWALENGYPGDDLRDRPPKAESASDGVSMI